jgi:hypothetical protein
MGYFKEWEMNRVAGQRPDSTKIANTSRFKQMASRLEDIIRELTQLSDGPHGNGEFANTILLLRKAHSDINKKVEAQPEQTV